MQPSFIRSLVYLASATLMAPGSSAALSASATFEVNNPLGFATCITNANNGDILLIKGKRMSRSSDGGRTFSEPVEMSVGVSGAIRLDEKHLIVRSGMAFYVSADDGASWEKRGQIDDSSVHGGEGEYPEWIGLGVPNYDVLLKGSGRLFLPVRGSAAANRFLASQSSAKAFFAESTRTSKAMSIDPRPTIPSLTSAKMKGAHGKDRAV